MKRFLTTGEAAQYFNVTVNTIKRWIGEGRLQAIITPGGHYRIPREEFKRFFERYSLVPSKRKILVVDDDPFALRMLVDGLSSLGEGYAVDSSRDGYEALIKIGEWKPHLLITDIKMPRLDGKEVIKKIRGMGSTKDLKVLVVSAYPEEAEGVKSLVQGIFVKPVDMKLLKERTRELLGEINR